MIKYLCFILILFCSCVGYGQKEKTFYNSNGVLKRDSTVGVYYGLAGIRKSEPIDTQKLYFHKFIFFTDLMNNSTGRRSARFEDSAEFYYKKLYKSK